MAVDEAQEQRQEGVAVKAQEVAEQAKEQVLERVDRVKGQGLEQLRAQLDTQSARLAERVAPFAAPLRKAGEHLPSPRWHGGSHTTLARWSHP